MIYLYIYLYTPIFITINSFQFYNPNFIFFQYYNTNTTRMKSVGIYLLFHIFPHSLNHREEKSPEISPDSNNLLA